MDKTERAEAENERLRAQLLTCGEEWQREAERQGDEVERLREALEDIADHRVGEVIEHVEAYARATLADEEVVPKWLPEDIHEALNLLQDRIGYTDSEHEAYQHIDAIRRILEKEAVAPKGNAS